MQNAYVTMAMILLLAAYGSPHQALASTQSMTADSKLVMPPVAYGVSPKGDQLSEADDACGVRDLLYSAVHDRLETRFEFMPPAYGASPKIAWLKLEIVDLFTISAGGPTIVGVLAQFERPGLPAAQYKAMRQMHMKYPEITAETTECSMIDAVIDALAEDIAQWMLTHSFPESP